MKNRLGLILLPVLLLGISVPAFACMCSQESLEKAIKKTDFVFVGKVKTIDEDKSYVSPKAKPGLESVQKLLGPIKRFIISLEIVRQFKGSKTDEIILVRYKLENDTCSRLTFRKGKKYLVFSKINKDTKEVNLAPLCFRTELFNKKSKNYNELKQVYKYRRL